MNKFTNPKTTEKLKRFFFENSLSIVLLTITVIFIFAQIISGILVYNEELSEYGKPAVSLISYLSSGHFLEALFENWESEFLQMGFYIWFTVFLRQKGSAESKPLTDEEPVDKEPDTGKKNAPGPVKKGGIWLKLYKNSLTYAFLLLFLLSFTMHVIGGAREENAEQMMKGKYEFVTPIEFAGTSKFWFQSFQNWQSEFLAVASIVLLSIFLRQKGSPESKPVDAPHLETGK